MSDISPSLYVWQVMGSNTQFILLSYVLTQLEKKRTFQLICGFIKPPSLRTNQWAAYF